jgi:hypothetical protein
LITSIAGQQQQQSIKQEALMIFEDAVIFKLPDITVLLKTFQL